MYYFPSRRFRRNGLIFLSVAVVFLALAAIVTVVRGGSNGTTALAAKLTPVGVAAPTSLPGGVPRYYVGLTDIGTNRVGGPIQGASVGDTGSGKKLAAVTPPSDTIFNAVQGSADDTTFVLAGAESPYLGTGGYRVEPMSQETSVWYLLRLTPGAAQLEQLTRLSISIPKGETTEDFAVSPDGKTLAIVTETARSAHYHATLRTYSLATGRVLRTWTTPLTGTALNDFNAFEDLRWLDDGQTLAFVYQPVDNNGVDLRAIPRYFHTLNTAGPGTDFLADSRTVFSVPPDSHACDSDVLMTGDGKSVICDNMAPNNGWCESGQLALTVYSVTTGKPEGVLYRYAGSCVDANANALWAPSATLAIVFTTGTAPPAGTVIFPPNNLFSVATPGKDTLLPVSSQDGRQAAIGYVSGMIAF